MGVYRRDSPYYWLLLERPDRAPIRESTKIPHSPPTLQQRKDNRALAEQIYHARMHDLALRRHDLPEDKPPITFTVFANWYATHVSAHKRGRDREEEILGTLDAAFGETLLTEITKDLVLEWMTARRVRVKASTVNRELDLLKHILVSAVPTYLAASPIAGLTRLRAGHVRTRLLKPSEDQKLLKVLAPADRALVLLGLDALLRLSEALNLQWADIHPTYLAVLDPKYGDTREVPISARLRAALDGLRRRGPYVFPHRRTATTEASRRSIIKNLLIRACAKATPPIPYGRGKGLTFHVLRHTGASRMIERGVDVRTVQELGGWHNLRQLTRYTHPTSTTKRRAVELVAQKRPA